MFTAVLKELLKGFFWASYPFRKAFLRKVIGENRDNGGLESLFQTAFPFYKASFVVLKAL